MAKKVVVLDGGTGISLLEMGHENIKNELLWSAAIVKTHPQDLVILHKNFFLGGADVVVTATYQASVGGYMRKFDISEAEAENLIRKGVELAKTARDEIQQMTGRHLYVAASVGPYGATLADWSEYDGRYADTMTKQELQNWHLPRLKLMCDAQPDLLAIETIPVVMEAVAILDALKSFSDIKAWVSFQCKDGEYTGHGERITEAVQAVCLYDIVIAVGVNCVHPNYVSSLLKHIKEAAPKVPILIKPNGGVFEHDGQFTERVNLCQLVEEWISLGATWIGGCCHIFSSDIKDLHQKLESISGIEFLKNTDQLY